MKVKMTAILIVMLMVFGSFSAIAIKINNNVSTSKLEKNSTTYRAVVVGVSQYAYVNSLRYCDDDAKDIKNVLDENGWDNINLLTDSQATKSAIITALNNLKNEEKAGDVSLFTFSGHGTRRMGFRHAICPHDALGPNSYIFDTELRGILNDFEGKVVCILDSCYSGGMDYYENLTERGDDFMTQFTWEFTTSFVENLSGYKSNRVILMACAAYEYSFEIPNLKNGVFSYFIEKGFSGEADGYTGDNANDKITAEETFNYAKEKTIDYLKQYQYTQVPHVYDGDKNDEVQLIEIEDDDDPDPEDPIPLDFSFVLHRIKALDEVEGAFHTPGADLSYKLSVNNGEKWEIINNNDYTTNADDSNPNNSPSKDIQYDFEITTRYPEIKLKVWERDPYIPFLDDNDILDVSSDPGWGNDDTNEDIQGTIFYCKYDVADNEIEEGNIVEEDGEYLYTSGELDNNANNEPNDGNDAKVWFKIVEDYEIPSPDLTVTGSINKDVEKDNEVNYKTIGEINIENDASDPHGFIDPVLNWEIYEYPDWEGFTWKFEPGKEGSINGKDDQDITVKIDVPNKKIDKSGTIKIRNKDNPSIERSVSVSLSVVTRSRSRLSYYSFLSFLMQRFPRLFFQQI